MTTPIPRRPVLAALALAPFGGFAPSRAALAQENDSPPFEEVPPGTADAPVPVEFPRDDGPHAALIEWWYYTGHLFTEDGRRFGFEQVVFKGERGRFAGLASHAAITDGANGRFAYDQRLVAAPDEPPDGPGFDLAVGNWTMRGADGEDEIAARFADYAWRLAITAEKPPVLHDGDGYIDYGSGEASYYYSRTRMAVAGTLLVDGEVEPVTGEAWMDHQWGDFATYDGGGWDWYALQLADGTDLMLYLINAPDGTPLILDGSLVAADGALTVLDGPDFSVEPTGTWTSPGTGVVYPSGWRLAVPAADLTLDVTPTLPEQELDTRASTGVIYWEGEVEVAGERAGKAITGLGYVELTGYANRT